MSVTFALGIPHTPWRPERVESLDRLREQTVIQPGSIYHQSSTDPKFYALFQHREPNWSWSAKMWRWAIETDATHFLTLQDDVIVSPDFWRHLRLMVEAVPDKVIGLESVHPKSVDVTSHWCTTLDCLVGVGYVVPIVLLREFLTWRKNLRPGAIESISEDTLLAVWCFVSGHEIWHPVPTIIDHDTDIPSTYGNDHHGHRRPYVTWRDRGVPADWTPVMPPFGTSSCTCSPSGSIVRSDCHDHGAKARDGVPHLGRFYDATPRMARRWIKEATEGDYERWMAKR